MGSLRRGMGNALLSQIRGDLQASKNLDVQNEAARSLTNERNRRRAYRYRERFCGAKAAGYRILCEMELSCRDRPSGEIAYERRAASLQRNRGVPRSPRPETA